MLTLRLTIIRLLICCVYYNAGLFVVASELRVSDEPEKVEEQKFGVHRKVTISRKVFYRETHKVAAIVTSKEILLDLPPRNERFLQFLVADGSWVQLNLDSRKLISMRACVELFVSSTEGSISVSAPALGYFETYFFDGGGRFLDGEQRKGLYKDLLNAGSKTVPK